MLSEAKFIVMIIDLYIYIYLHRSKVVSLQQLYFTQIYIWPSITLEILLQVSLLRLRAIIRISYRQGYVLFVLGIWLDFYSSWKIKAEPIANFDSHEYLIWTTSCSLYYFLFSFIYDLSCIHISYLYIHIYMRIYTIKFLYTLFASTLNCYIHTIVYICIYCDLVNSKRDSVQLVPVIYIMYITIYIYAWERYIHLFFFFFIHVLIKEGFRVCQGSWDLSRHPLVPYLLLL